MRAARAVAWALLFLNAALALVILAAVTVAMLR